VAVAEFTVAAHLLFFLPPPVQAAAPIPQNAEESSGESALAMLRIERSEPATQEPVEVNKTVPNVQPPPQYPTFSPIPTDAELIRARVFGEPLIPEAGEQNDAENQALAQAITTYLYGGDSEALEPLEGVVTSFPQSRWRVAVQANVGSWYKKKGYFTRAQRNLLEAWRLGKDSKTEGVRRLAEVAAGELMLLHAQFGQVDPLEALTTEFVGRELSGAITEKLYIGQATVWGLRNDHQNAIPSGSVALERLRLDKHENEEKRKKDQDPNYKRRNFQRHAELDKFPAKHEGASLSEIQDLADLTDLKLQMVKRELPTAEIPLPALVHLKQGHFAALVGKREKRFRFDDPLLGGEVWMSREAFEEEISGFFLIERGPLPQGWRAASPGETGPIRGKCIFATGDGGGGTRPNVPCKPCGGGGGGMAVYRFHLLRASLSITDTPVGYSPPRGPEARFQATYNQREATQPSTFFYSNLGKRWVHHWMSYVEDDPTAVGDPVELFVRGGGKEPYEGFVNGVSAPEQDTRAVMTIVSTSPIQYERELPDGSKEVFAQSDGASTAPRRVFLTKIQDPQGNMLMLTYDGQLRLVSVTDAIEQVTTLSYELPSDPLKITKVTDPFGRFAKFEYDDGGQLVKITDVIGISSEFEYGVNYEYLTGTTDFVRAMTTPYGTTTFRSGIGPYASVNNNRWVEATDPLGGTERVEHILNGTNPLPASDDPDSVPAGFTGNSALNAHLSIYYSKLVMDRQTTDPPDPEDGEIFRFRSSSQFKVSAYQLHSTKLPLENRVWYEHEGETTQNGVGPSGRPSKIGRVLDDGSSQVYRYEYNSRGGITRQTDPVGRETVYEYAANEQDLLNVKQKNGTNYDLLQELTYNATHQPLTVKDASAQTTTHTYNGQGQILTIVTPPRTGITENRTTTYSYDSNGYLQSVTGPATGATASYTYDSYGRTRTATDSDGYVLTFDYDALDRQTKVTYPDSTYDETVYDRLDAVRTRDRLGRWIHRVYDALRRGTATTDPLGRTVIQQWCSCGSMDALLDANGNETSWERDLQGRVTKEIRANGSEWVYAYETTSSRLKTVTDSKGQVKTYSYSLDDNLQGVSYANEQYETPNVSFTYETAFNRVSTMVDGTGTTTYGYHPIGGTPPPGAGSLSSVDGPVSNDAITYTYDELGRVRSRAINGVALTYEYDALGRIGTENNVLGSFSYQYDGVTNRLDTVTYPNGQTTSYAYYSNSGDHRLQEIHHKKSGGTTLSKFNYTYDVVGNILTWTQQQDTNPAKAYEFEYDRVDQLQTAVWRTTDQTPTILKRFGYTYDPAGNRTVEQIDNAPVLSVYDNMNRLSSQSPGGTMRFAGTLNEAATVMIQGAPATLTSDNRFAGGAEVTSGTSQVVVKAKDYSGNERTNTYEVSQSGSSKSFTFDANGNMTGDGTRTFEWDAENRLLAISQGVLRSEFTYDGLGRWVRLIEKNNGVVASDLRFLWCESSICEERDSAGSTTLKRFVGHGMQANGNPFFYTRDHLGSVRELLDSLQVMKARYEYDVFGKSTKVAGDTESPFQFTGHYFHAVSGLFLTYHRAYNPTSGRWISEDPIGRDSLGNTYTYARNNPVTYTDPYGLVEVKKEITVTGSPDPDLQCAKPTGGGCFRPGAAFATHKCVCEGNTWKAKTTFTVRGTIFVYTGRYPYKGRKPKDPSVKDRASAEGHEWSWHIDPAIAAAVKILEGLEQKSFGSQPECEQEAASAKAKAVQEYWRVLSETQKKEDQKK
jgi:RHS repeat-associated protein